MIFEMRAHSLSLTLLTIVVISAYDIAKTSQDGGEGEEEKRYLISACKRCGRGRGVASTGARGIRYHCGGGLKYVLLLLLSDACGVQILKIFDSYVPQSKKM